MSPDTFLALAKTNIIYAGSVPVKTITPIVSMRLSVMDDYTLIGSKMSGSGGGYRKNNVITGGFTPKVYSLVRGAGQNDCFDAYICNYADNYINAVYLGNGASMAFTVTLNSCTFGIGQQTDDGVLITHANSRGSNVGLRTIYGGSQDNAQARATRDVLGQNASLLEKNDYYINTNDGFTYTTVFGLRQNNRWAFYRQTFKMNRIAKTAELTKFAAISQNQVNVN